MRNIPLNGSTLKKLVERAERGEQLLFGNRKKEEKRREINVSDFSTVSSQALIGLCGFLLNDPMALGWIKNEQSLTMLDQQVRFKGWSNEMAIAFKAAHHLMKRFPEIWEAETSKPMTGRDRYRFSACKELPELQAESARILGPVEIPNDEPLLCRELRGDIVTKEKTWIDACTYDLDGSIQPIREHEELLEGFFRLNEKKEPPIRFGFIQDTDGKIKPTVFDINTPLQTDQIAIYTQPMFHYTDGKMPRFGKFMKYVTHHHFEDIYLREEFRVFIYKDLGDNHEKHFRGEVGYYRKYLYYGSSGHTLNIMFMIEPDWSLKWIMGPDVNTRMFFQAGENCPENPPSLFEKKRREEHREMLLQILGAYGKPSMLRIAGQEMLDNPPTYLHELLI